MLTEENFFRLKNELINAVVVFEENEMGYKLYFTHHSNFQEFKKHLNHLSWDFINEVRNNLCSLKTNGEVHLYLEILIHGFEILDEQVGEDPDFTTPHRNAKIVSKTNSYLSFVHIGTDDLSQILAYFQLQKRIIQKSCKFIRIFRKKCKKSENYLLESNLSWQDKMREFFPHITRLKDILPKHKVFNFLLIEIQLQVRGLQYFLYYLKVLNICLYLRLKLIIWMQI